MQRKSAGHWQIERLAEDRIDHTAMTGNGDVSAGMGVDDAPYCGADASVKGRCRLASRKYLDVRISRPIRCSETQDVLIERHPVDFWSRIVLSEVRPPLNFGETDRRSDDFGGLNGAGKVAGD